MSQKVDNNIIDIISSADVENNVLKLTCGQLDRKSYVAFNKVMEILGGKWNRKLSGHVFDKDPSEAIESLIRTGEITDTKKLYQAYFTPAELAKYVVNLADIQDDDLVLEPSIGSGNLAVLMKGNLHFCEIQDDLVSELDPDILKKAVRVGKDFLDYHPGEIYDKIVANPPFTKSQDVIHVNHMLDCCKPGGKIVSIMSPGITFKTDSKTKALLERLSTCNYYSIEQLDNGSFKESGTMVNTIVITIIK